MTLLEFYGCGLVTFGPPLVMFSTCVAQDPVKIIFFIISAFFWLMSFLLGAICWHIVAKFCDYLIIGAYLAVLFQEASRYLLHVSAKKAQILLNELISSNITNNRNNSTQPQNATNNPNDLNELPVSQESRRGEIQLEPNTINVGSAVEYSYVSGIGFGLMNSACLTSNLLADSIGPGTVGLKGDSPYFLLVSALTALAFVLLNIAWSVLVFEGVEKSERKLLIIVVVTHLIATTTTFANRVHFQIMSVFVVYALATVCGFGAFQAAGLEPRLLWQAYRRRD